MDEGSDNLGNPGSSENEKVGGGTSNTKSVPSKNLNSALKLKAPHVNIDPQFPQRLKKKEENSKFQKFLSMLNRFP